jgi:hypothetical protein
MRWSGERIRHVGAISHFVIRRSGARIVAVAVRDHGWPSSATTTSASVMHRPNAPRA